MKGNIERKELEDRSFKKNQGRGEFQEGEVVNNVEDFSSSEMSSRIRTAKSLFSLAVLDSENIIQVSEE